EERHPAILLLDQHHADHSSRWPPRRQERLDRLLYRFAILLALHRLPTLRIGGQLRQADAVLAIRRQRSTLTCPPLGRRQIAQVSVLAQAADHPPPGGFSWTQEGLLGITAIDDRPEFLETLLHPRFEPAQLGNGQFQFGAEGPWAFRRQPID